MNLDTGKAAQVRILADKTGPTPAPGQPWPSRGVEFIGDPPTLWAVSINWVRHYWNSSWLTVEGARTVTRPSRPNPAVGEGGSAAVAPEHYSYHPDLFPPHEFLHVDALVLQTPDGALRYEVVRQPDKYVAGDETGTKKVTAKVYDAGDTEVEHHFTVQLVNSAQEG